MESNEKRTFVLKDGHTPEKALQLQANLQAIADMGQESFPADALFINPHAPEDPPVPFLKALTLCANYVSGMTVEIARGMFEGIRVKEPSVTRDQATKLGRSAIS